MGDRSAIEWCDASWNPIRGCSRVSEGCRNCYAERDAIRMAHTPLGSCCDHSLDQHEPLDLPPFTAPAGRCAESGCRCRGWVPDPKYPAGPYYGLVKSTPTGPRWTGAVRFVPELLDLPLRWRRPRRIFVNSMSDLFHEKVEDEWIARIFSVMYASPRHVFQVLTKRPERMQAWLSRCGNGGGLGWITHDGPEPEKAYRGTGIIVGNTDRWPLPNVWLGTSCEDQPTAEARIIHLLQTPAAVRFASYEPALAAVDFMPWLVKERRTVVAAGGIAQQETIAIDWLIAGGESGPGARPFDLAWARSAIAQCRAAGVPCFVKQLGARPCSSVPSDPFPPCDALDRDPRASLRDRKGGDMAEWPEDLRVQEFPG